MMSLQKIEVQKDKVIITKTETKEIELGDGRSVGDLKRSCRAELGNIIRQVKSLKARAEELKETLAMLEGIKEPQKGVSK